MTYHEQLLDLAIELAHREPGVTLEADLRRAVSTAYYALFHLLTSETVANWSDEATRKSLGRMFEHGRMRRVSEKIGTTRQTTAGTDGSDAVETLRRVAVAFVQLQDSRKSADYDLAEDWGRTEALTEVKRAEEAFQDWKLVRAEPIAKSYLIEMLIRPRD